MYISSKTVTTAGTPEALAVNADIVPDSWIGTSTIVRAKKANTGKVYVLANNTSTTKWPEDDGLLAEEAVTIPIDPRQLRIDVSVNGEGVDWLAV